MQPDMLLRKVNYWRYQLIPYIERLGLDIGFLDGHSDYNRFIILGRSRSGTNFLRGLLNSHSQIVVLGELFQNKNAIGWAYPGYLKSQKDLALFRTEPVRFLKSRVFRQFPRRITAVGFKIFYYHAQDDLWKPVWNYLAEQKDITVIHNKRKNILRTHLSRKLASMTDVWVSTQGGSQDGRSVTLDFDDCLRDFTQTREWENSYDQLFFDHKKVEVYYEDLAADYVNEMRRIQSCLGVELQEVKPQTFKQSHQSLSRSITNYYELKEQFAGSPWEIFFEE